MKPIGRARISKIINQMILHNKLHKASTTFAMLFSDFDQKTLWSLKILYQEYINNSLHLARKYARYLSADIICSEKRTVFRERSSRKNVSFEEQIMSKDKYPRIFSPQMETIVFIILQIFYATRAYLKIGVYSLIFPSFSWGNIRSPDGFGPIARERKYLMDYKIRYLYT